MFLQFFFLLISSPCSSIHSSFFPIFLYLFFFYPRVLFFIPSSKNFSTFLYSLSEFLSFFFCCARNLLFLLSSQNCFNCPFLIIHDGSAGDLLLQKFYTDKNTISSCLDLDLLNLGGYLPFLTSDPRHKRVYGSSILFTQLNSWACKVKQTWHS